MNILPSFEILQPRNIALATALVVGGVAVHTADKSVTPGTLANGDCAVVDTSDMHPSEVWDKSRELMGLDGDGHRVQARLELLAAINTELPAVEFCISLDGELSSSTG